MEDVLGSFGGPPDRPALRFPERTLSYAELAHASQAVAAAVTAYERVAVIAEPTLETCVAVIGALRAGVPVIPLNPRSGPSELTHVAADADPGAVLARPGSVVPQALADRPLITVALDAGPVALWTPRELDPAGPALIVYTSGTTGPPKGAVLPRRAIASNLDALAAAWDWTAADTVAHGLPLFHVHGLVLGILGPVRRGGSAVHTGRFSPEAIGHALRDCGATMVFGVPTMYRRLADAAEDSPELSRALSGARLLASGSAALPRADYERFTALTGRTVVERYGMTETLISTAVRAGADPAPGTVGPPLDGVELRLIADHGGLIAGAEEAIGEIEIRGPSLFTGYLNRPVQTAAAFGDGWFRTGDLATRDEHGNLRIVGRRATDLIKSGGYKIGAGEIEAVLREHPAVEDAAVTGEPDPDLGERVVAWVVRRAGADVGAPELTDHVSDQLAPHKRPRAIHFLTALPRNELGKVQKQRLGAG